MPAGVLHGTMNAVLYLQSSTSSKIPSEICDAYLRGLDDIFGTSTTIVQHLERFQIFFKFFLEHNLKMLSAMCIYFCDKRSLV